jgi:hypothetical protein
MLRVSVVVIVLWWLGVVPPVLQADRGVMVRGVVYDSLGGRPLGDAIVQLATDDADTRVVATATSDRDGVYRIRDVEPGRYRIGFLHPVLDSLGLEPPLRTFVVTAERDVQLDLATPSATRLRALICADTSGRRAVARADSGSVLFGIVRGSDGAPVARATVVARWVEVTFGLRGAGRRVAQRASTTADNGWYALCDVPSGGQLSLAAGRDTMHVARIEWQAGDAAAVQRDLVLPSGQTALARGVVLRGSDGQPLAGAVVRLEDGRTVRTDESGAWSMPAVNDGMQMIYVRAVGYLPQRLAMEVYASPRAATVALRPMQPLLDTVRVRGERLGESYMAGFEERRRQGIGRYLTREEIGRRRVMTLTDLLRMLPGVRVEYDAQSGRTSITVRGGAGEACTPIVLLNGMVLGALTGEELDALARPDEVGGLELYSEVNVPPAFSMSMAGEGCGSIVVWLPLGRR